MWGKFKSSRRKFKNWLWGDFFGPLNRRRFEFRIYLRVRSLRFRQWSKRWSWSSLFRHFPRPLAVLGLFALTLFLLWFAGMPLPALRERLAGLINGEGEPLQWQTALILTGVPVAFILWIFRDINARINLENQRKDINLKEFQEIQLRAAGALDDSLPDKARETLQIAAIHQLRPFLRGEYGESFRRPAWELLRARLATSAEQLGYFAIDQWAESDEFSEENGESLSDQARRKVAALEKKIRAIRPGPVTQAERALVQEEVAAIFRQDLPLQTSHFGGIIFPSEAMLAGLELSRTSFIGANLNRAHLEGVELNVAHLEGAELNVAHFEGADLYGAYLEGARLTTINPAILNSCDYAIFDDDTAFAEDWRKISEEEREKARKPWRDRGAIHVDEAE